MPLQLCANLDVSRSGGTHGRSISSRRLGQYPTTIVGLVTIFTALMYARDPERRRYAIVKTLSIVVLLTSVLGFTVGMMKSFLGSAHPPTGEGPEVALIGVGESLNNLALGLCILVVTWIMVAIGASRVAAPPTREDLHAA